MTTTSTYNIQSSKNICLFLCCRLYVATTSTSSTSTSNSLYVYVLCRISFFVIHRFNIYHMYVEIFEYKIEIQLCPLCIHKHKRLPQPQVSVRIKKILFYIINDYFKSSTLNSNDTIASVYTNFSRVCQHSLFNIIGYADDLYVFRICMDITNHWLSYTRFPTST